MKAEPAPSGSEQWDVFLAASAEHLAARDHRETPAWADWRSLRRCVIVDSSAVVAILLREPGWEGLLELIAHAEPTARIGAPTRAETGVVLSARLRIPGKTLLARFVQESDMRQVQFTADHRPIAVDAYLRFGKNRHRAALNFGDCMTYAVSRLAGEPLLCIGANFAKTDLTLAAPRIA